MSLNEIKELPIVTLADTECYVFLWTIQKFLQESFTVLNTWGFSHLLTMVWEKTYGRSAGMPLYGFRWNAEFILVGYPKNLDPNKNLSTPEDHWKPPLWPKQKLIPAVFQAENIKHSQKPNKFYELIEPLGEKRIDIFARQKRIGWDVWGDEV